MLNLSPLFYSTADDDTLIINIELAPERKEDLSASKTLIRQHLRDQLPKVLEADKDVPTAIKPRFFTQGSWAYKTLNAPAQAPQQCDIDDGTYLPMSFMQEEKRPSVASKAFFRAVEATLAPLAHEMGWELDTSKPTCVRVVLADDAHEDIPLYAIPDAEFAALKEAMKAHRSATWPWAVDAGTPDDWETLPEDSVLLAHREKDWIRSDPRPIKDWFEKAVTLHGEQLRRVVRYLKAYRDWQWPTGGPASILLMAATVTCFEQRKGRDDMALLDALRELPRILRAGVCNPADNSESLTDRLGPEGVEEACTKLEMLTTYLQAAMDASNPAQACAWMRHMFGDRFPNRPDRVKPTTVEETVKAAPAAAVATPLVGRSKAG